MSEAIAAVHANQAPVAAAYQRLAAALAEETPLSTSSNPSDVERSHAAVSSARVALAQAEAEVNAAQTETPAPAAPAETEPAVSLGHGPAHLVEIVA